MKWRENLVEITARWCAGGKISKVAHVAVARTKKSGARTPLVFSHNVSLLVCFVSHGFASVSHPKFLFRFEAKQAKLGGQFRYFASKGFASFCFSFALKQNSGTP